MPPHVSALSLALWLFGCSVGCVRCGNDKYNISYSVLEETDGPVLIGDLAADLNLLRFYSSERLAEKQIEFLRTNPDYNAHFQVRRVQGAYEASVKHELVLVKRLDREQVCPETALVSDCFLALSCSVKPYDEPILLFTVRVFVLDLNDHPPVFDPTHHTVHFSESDLVGAKKPIPHATDADSGRNARIAYELEPASSQFRVDSDSPTQVYLTLAAELDREAVASYKLNVSARDFGDIKLAGYLQLNVIVTDTNDCFPVFDRESYRVSIIENSMPKPALQVRATDGDIDENGRVKYQLAPATPSSVRRFVSVGMDDGQVNLERAIDREELSELEFQVRAVDSGSPAKTSATTVRLTILDLNDCVPRIELPARRAGVFEGRPHNTVVMSFTVKDDDLGVNGSVRCTLDQNGGSEFEVKEYDSKLKVFQILTRDQLDRETRDSYLVSVRCVDGGGRESKERLTIIVEDENDHFPVFVQSHLYRSVSENCEIGFVIANLSATDGDINENGLISYYIIRDGSVPETSNFDVTRHGGTVTVSRRLDREQRSSLTLFVVAQDNGMSFQFSSTATIYIEIKDVNDVAPILPGTVDFSVEENGPPGIKLGPIRATDPDTDDGGRVTFYGSDKDSFTVTEDGYLVAKRSFDREIRQSYLVQVYARDYGIPSLTSSTRVTVQIMDRNDCTPQFIFPARDANYSVPMSVQEQPGFLILQAVAKDADEGENSRIRYSLDPSSRLFIVSQNSGRLQTQLAMQTADIGSYRLVIRAADCGVPRLETTVAIHVTVEDIPAKEQYSTAPSNYGTAAVTILVSLTLLLLLLIVCVLAFVIQRRRAILASTGDESGGGEYKFMQRRHRQKLQNSRGTTSAALQPLTAAESSQSAAVAAATVGDASDEFKVADNVYCSNPYFCN